jgi:hypothetical protein
MSSRNATASWSGYAHQGKVGLLVALRKINELKCTGLNAYRLELETQEDAKITQGANVIEVHQVKALMDADTIGSYTKALCVYEACTGHNYLHTICEITNWGNLTATQNKENVLRYPYTTTKDYCGLDEIDQYIFDEIKAILSQLSHVEKDNTGWFEGAFREFLALLDERIRTEHQQGNLQTYQIAFGLEEILALLTNPPSKRNALVCAIRRSIYDRYAEFVRNLAASAYPAMTHAHEQFVVDIIAEICLLEDDRLEEFLNQIFPASTQGKTLGTCTLSDDFFISKDFASTFLFTLISIEKQKLILEDGAFPHYKAGLNYLLTALQHTPVECMGVSEKILKNTKLNTTRYETDFIINEQLTGKLSEHARKVIERNGRFIDEKEIEFITREEAVKTLN